MAWPVKLPWELEEEILSRLPPRFLVPFRSVCKRWNTLMDEKMFINSHFACARPQFIFMTNSKIYSIDIIGLDGVDPTIELHELASSGTPWELNLNQTTITTCDGILFISHNLFGCQKETALWNPWLKQVKWIENEDIKSYDKTLYFCGLGYDNTRPEKVYKILGYFVGLRNEVQKDYNQRVVIYEFASQAFKFIDTPDEDWPLIKLKGSYVSLNGNLYWIVYSANAQTYSIKSFDFSREIIKPFCLLPCRDNWYMDRHFLSVFKGDGFSLLKLCSETSKIEIWVTKKKIDSNNNGEEVVWINLMTLPTTTMTNLLLKYNGIISYFIYDKTTLIMCCGEKGFGTPCICIVRGDMFKKIQINSGFYDCCHCVYAPNLIPLF